MKLNNFFEGQEVYCAGFSKAGVIKSLSSKVYDGYPIMVEFISKDGRSHVRYFNDDGICAGEEEPTLSTVKYLFKGFTQLPQEEKPFEKFIGKFVKFYNNGEFICIARLAAVSKGVNGIRFLCEDGFTTCNEIQLLSEEELKIIGIS